MSTKTRFLGERITIEERNEKFIVFLDGLIHEIFSHESETHQAALHLFYRLVDEQNRRFVIR